MLRQFWEGAPPKWRNVPWKRDPFKSSNHFITYLYANRNPPSAFLMPLSSSDVGLPQLIGLVHILAAVDVFSLLVSFHVISFYFYGRCRRMFHKILCCMELLRGAAWSLFPLPRYSFCFFTNSCTSTAGIYLVAVNEESSVIISYGSSKWTPKGMQRNCPNTTAEVINEMNHRPQPSNFPGRC